MAKDFHLCLEQSYSQKILMPDWFSLLWVTRALGDGLVCYHQALTLWNILGHQVHDSKTAPRFIKYNLMHVMHQQQDLIQNLERHFVVLNSRMSDLEDNLEHMELGLKMLRKSCLTSEHQDQMRFILIPLTTVSSTCFSTSLADDRWANPEGFPRSPAGFCIIRWDWERSACRDGPSPSLIQKGWQARAGRDLHC